MLSSHAVIFRGYGKVDAIFSIINADCSIIRHSALCSMVFHFCHWDTRNCGTVDMRNSIQNVSTPKPEPSSRRKLFAPPAILYRMNWKRQLVVNVEVQRTL
jgi:hypothetical protein